MRYDDPILETIARSIHTFFPRCVRCGEPIESFEDADIRILTNRVVHRDAGCGTRACHPEERSDEGSAFPL